MAGKTYRKLGLLDAMILVAAIAVWLAAIRYFGPASRAFESNPIWMPGEGGWARLLPRQICLLLFVLSLAIVLIGFRSPRGGRRRLFSQPGLTACASAVLGVLVHAFSEAVYHHVALSNWLNFLPWAFLYRWPYAGPAVAGAWLTLCWTGRWRAERTAIDRLGQVIGVCWLVQFLLVEMPGRRWVSIVARLLEGVTS